MDSRRIPSVAEWYHEETKYLPSTLGLLPRPDPDQQPLPWKQWHSPQPIDLVPYLPFPEFPLGPAADQQPVDSESLSQFVGALSRMLYFTNGATGILESSDGEYHQIFRAAPSAGALYPTDITLALRGIRGLEDGLFAYSVLHHQLVPLFDGDALPGIASACWDHPAFDGIDAAAILSGVWLRSRWRYHDRAYRRILLDTGHVLGNLVHAAGQEGLQAVPLAGFEDSSLQNLMFLDDQEEGVLVVVPLCRSATPGPAADLSASVRRSEPSQAPPDLDDDVMLALHSASSIDGDTAVVSPPDASSASGATTAGEHQVISLEDTLSDLSRDFPRIIVGRRSTRQFTGAMIDRHDMARVLDFAHRFASPGPVRYLSAGSALQIHVVTHRVRGIESGVWRYLVPDHQLQLVSAGEVHPQVQEACLGQELAGDAACLVVYSADLPAAVEIWGDRAYRYLHLDAGFLGQQLNLACVHQQLGVSGIAGFFDDAWNKLLQLPHDHAITYVTAIGDAAAG
ncbi:MAG: SagB/ThcOx family dehydrogenase [Planctomycetota bacterium]|nr:SagB/ThcOx family dehydrogenase [Planctomycetota bacterium]